MKKFGTDLLQARRQGASWDPSRDCKQSLLQKGDFVRMLQLFLGT